MSASIDQLITGFDRFLRTSTGSVSQTKRKTPASSPPSNSLSAGQRKRSAQLMRVNHCGEVCAQALYQGQALTSSSPRTSAAMMQAAAEEEDHLYWCQTRLKELDSRVSHLNPFFYVASFATGALAGLLGDRINLGFVAATESEVSRHLEDHIDKLPEEDARSREILEQMRKDEQQHESTALALGGARFPQPVKAVMAWSSKLMTRTTYWV